MTRTAVWHPASETSGRSAARDTVLRARARYHVLMLIGAVGVLACAAVLHVRGESFVTLPVLGTALPELCTWRRLVGVDCPGCGLTRCFVSAMHGDLAAAWRFHPAGLVLFGLVWSQLPFRWLQIHRLRRGRHEWRVPAGTWLGWSLVPLLLGQWVWRMLS